MGIMEKIMETTIQGLGFRGYTKEIVHHTIQELPVG